MEIRNNDEILNRFAQRPDPAGALCMPLSPIPAGRRNDLCIDLLGPEQGLNLVLASLNPIKGRPLPPNVLIR